MRARWLPAIHIPDLVWMCAVFASAAALLWLWHGPQLAPQAVSYTQPGVLHFFYSVPMNWTTLLPPIPANLLLVFEIALQGALLFWLGRSLMSGRAALLCAVFFLWMQVQDLIAMPPAQDRSNSATLVLAAVCCAWRARGAAHSGWWLFSSGVLAGCAALCTGSAALAGAAILVWTISDPAVRRGALPWVGGACALIAVMAALLWWQGLLWACVRDLRALAGQYGSLVPAPYEAASGAYHDLLTRASGGAAIVRYLILFRAVLPAMIPIVAVAAGLIWMLALPVAPRQQSVAILLTVSATAMVTSSLPTFDAAHLAWVSAMPFLLAFTAVATLANGQLQGIIVAVYTFSSLLAVPR